ncbi:MAG: hypothetical protein AMK69_14565 [Nitrospira bacterium SG8_3]|nr:MAG: hypothetical protein AMK69_14565 [Nitrospira bacterium SG8_3]
MKHPLRGKSRPDLLGQDSLLKPLSKSPTPYKITPYLNLNFGNLGTFLPIFPMSIRETGRHGKRE